MFDMFKTVRIHDTQGTYLKDINVVNIEPVAEVVLYDGRVFLLDPGLGGYRETMHWSKGSDPASADDTGYYT